MLLIIGVFLCFIGFSAVPLPLLAQESEVVENAEVTENNDTQELPTLYVREGCSHCATVKAFMSANGIEDQVIVRDIIEDPKASEDYTSFMEANEVPLSERGAVPVLTYDENKWITGDTPIITYLAEKHDIELPEKNTSNNDNDLLLVLGGSIILIIVGYGIAKNVKSARK